MNKHRRMTVIFPWEGYPLKNVTNWKYEKYNLNIGNESKVCKLGSYYHWQALNTTTSTVQYFYICITATPFYCQSIIDHVPCLEQKHCLTYWLDLHASLKVLKDKYSATQQLALRLKTLYNCQNIRFLL